MLKLYLDDLRTIPDGFYGVRTYENAIRFVGYCGIPNYISFDHDLGEEKTGYDFAKWLVEQDLCGSNKFPDDFEFNVHSANPVGVKNIEGLFKSYFGRVK